MVAAGYSYDKDHGVSCQGVYGGQCQFIFLLTSGRGNEPRGTLDLYQNVCPEIFDPFMQWRIIHIRSIYINTVSCRGGNLNFHVILCRHHKAQMEWNSQVYLLIQRWWCVMLTATWRLTKWLCYNLYRGMSNRVIKNVFIFLRLDMLNTILI